MVKIDHLYSNIKMQYTSANSAFVCKFTFTFYFKTQRNYDLKKYNILKTLLSHKEPYVFFCFFLFLLNYKHT